MALTGKAADVFTCECGETTTIDYWPATRTDPGCYAEDLECSGCGAELDPSDPEPLTLEDLRWANHPDV
jgi:hypothetical protein